MLVWTTVAAQPAGPDVSAGAVAVPSSRDQLTQALDEAIVALDKSALPNPTLRDGLTRARRLANEADHQAQSEDNAILWLFGLTALFVLLSAAVLLVLAGQVRKAFYKAASEQSENTWRAQLMQLPLGAPEGSVRSLISLYVVVFGLLVLVMQRRLGLQSVDAVAGFIGIVITFYFTARTNDQAQRATDQAQKTMAEARSAVTAAGNAVTQNQEAMKVQTSALRDTVRAAFSDAQPIPAPVLPESLATVTAATTAASTFGDLRNDLQLGRQVLGALGGLGVGSQVIGGADLLVNVADKALSTIDQAISGGTTGPDLAKVAQSAQATLGVLDEAGLPGVLGGAMSALIGVAKIAGPALAGLPGGPVGVVAGVITGGLQVLADQRKFDAWKTAVLGRPFDRSLMPGTVDGNTAALVLELAPLMRARLADAPQNIQTELLRKVIETSAEGDPKPVADLAHDLLTGDDALGLRSRFASEAELAEALEEYRSTLLFSRARDLLDRPLAIPAVAGLPASTVDFGKVLDAAASLRADPRGASALEKLVYVVQALGALKLDPAKLASLVESGLAAGAAMVGKTRTNEDPRT